LGSAAEDKGPSCLARGSRRTFRGIVEDCRLAIDDCRFAAFNETKQPDGKQLKPKETTSGNGNRKAAAPPATTKGKTKVTPGIKKATPRVTPRAKRGMHE
jgi:hypothetical protein